MKTIYISIVCLFFSTFLFSQEKTKVTLISKAFETNVEYSINTTVKSNFTVNIYNSKKKNVLNVIHKSIFGEQSFKKNISKLAKGDYLLEVLDKNSNTIFEKKIKKHFATIIRNKNLVPENTNCLDSDGGTNIDTSVCNGGLAPFCSGFDTPFCNSNAADGDPSEAQIGINYSTARGGGPNDPTQWRYPTWLYIQIENSGNFVVEITQWDDANNNGINDAGERQLDVDFIAWGPFPGNTICDGRELTPANKVDGSWLIDTTETMTINNAVAGDTYVVMIANYSTEKGVISLNQDTSVSNPATSDCSIIAGELGADQDVCEGTSVTLDGTSTSANVTGYEWFLDTGTGFNIITGEIDPTLVIGTTNVPAISGNYKVEVSDSDGNTAEDEVMITFHPQPTTATLPFTTYEQCDTDGTEDGFFTFDLQTLFAADLLNGQDTAIFEVVFYNSQADADANTNPISNSANPDYTNAIAFTSDEIFARVINIASPNACTPATTSFNLLVNPNPTLQNPADYELCDDNVDGDDTNGIVQNFILSTKDTEVLGAQDPADFTVTYYENQNDADNNLSPIDKVNPYTNTPAFTQPIFVRVTNNTTGCFTASTGTLFNLIVNPLPVVTNPVLLSLCDTDQDGIASFNLRLAEPLISTDSANETFRYYPSETDADNNTNEITNPTNYSNVIDTNDAVWVRTITVNGCFRVSQINLQVTNTVIPVTFQRTYEECDDFLDINGNDTINNDDRDGITSFNFSSVDSEIIAEFLTTGQTFNITHYTTLADANAVMNPIADISNYRNIGFPNTQQIFTRVENPADNTCLYVGTHITLNVDPIPFANAVDNIEVCDDDTDADDTNGFVQSINLESQNTTILGTQDPTQYTVTYHESASDANTGTSALSSPYTNTIANQQTIHIRVTNNTTGCFVDRANFDVIIHPLPITTAAVELKQCDDDTDGFSDFNLTEANSAISSNFINETFTFYPTLNDAENDTNTITNPTVFTNRTVTTDIVWARAISIENCYRISELTLTVSTTGLPASFQRTFNNCDDFLDIDGNDNGNNDDTDGVSSFDFSSVTAEVLALFPTSQQLIITYYRNQADALAEVNSITDTSNYRNIGYPNSQQIYIRVDSNLDNDCLGFGPFITLTVDPVPVSNPVADLELCDNFDDGNFENGIVQTFNLDAQTPIILGTQDPTNYAVTYHTSANDASLGSNAISNTAMYENITANQQTIYVRVTHTSAGCYVDRLTFDLIVNPLPVANFVEDLETCDDDSDGSAQDGFSQSIDLELQTPGILGTQDPAIFSVTYHASLADAQAGTAPLTSPFTNTVAFSQIIYVRILNSVTQCVNSISNFNAIVNPEPTTENIGDILFCDDNTDGDDTNGFIQNIDLDSQVPGILGPLQDEDDFTVTFHETQADASAGTDALSSPYSNTTRDRQTIFIRVLNNDTGCVNDDDTFNAIINPLPDFTVTSPQIVCLNGPPLTISVENPASVYDYVWTDPAGNDIIGSQITITSGGLYTVTGTTTDGTSCSRTLEIQVNESIIATISDADVTIVDDSDNNSITIDPTNLGIGEYEYALLDENRDFAFNYQDSPVFENLGGGFYTILVRDKNGCGTVTLVVSVVEFPKFFTPNNDGINDTWAIKGANSTFFPTSQISIFNRFGKVVAQIKIDNPGWNGYYNGKILPSDDYWYSINLIDRNGIVRERKGNLSLIRR